ncbi:MAG: DUF1501 domain-containing protein [Acidimicrobiales bacterium]|nr:DUF1501 domain-containing protein [Acidimicrobiales bacterium]
MSEQFPPQFLAAIDRLGDDPEYEEIHAALSAPVDQRGFGRRTFLQGALAAGSATALTLGPLAKAAAAVEPLESGDTILVVIQLGGGNDGLNMVGPFGDPAYSTLRRATSVAAGSHPLGVGGLSFHPALPKLAARFQQGKVAVVQGVGDPDKDHSHFSAMAKWMAGTAGDSRTTGWLGRYLDTIPDSDQGFRAVSVDGSIPLHLLGNRSQVSALAEELPFGAERDKGTEVALYEAIRNYGSQPTGLGRLGDAIASMDRECIDLAREFVRLGDPSSDGDDLTRQLRTAAKVVNLNIGVRVIGATLASFDTHRTQAWMHNHLLSDLDEAIDVFYSTLDAQWADQVVIMTFSEFGRRAGDNGSGTDHGTSAPLLVVGDRVRGGLHGRYPSLTALDERGDLEVHVDFRSVYASVLQRWLGADATQILGGTYPQLDLFKSKPPEPSQGPPTKKDPRFLPFDDVAKFVIQQFHDFRGVHPKESDLLAWGNVVYWGFWSIPVALEQMYVGSDLYRFGVDGARTFWMGTGGPPEVDDIWRWTKMRATGSSMEDIAAEVVSSDAWRDRYGRLYGTNLINKVHTDLMGAPPSAQFLAYWQPKFAHENDVNAATMLAQLSMTPYGRLAYHHRACVATVFAAMLRRPPEAEQNRQWATLLDRGAVKLEFLLSTLYESAEYRSRFA